MWPSGACECPDCCGVGGDVAVQADFIWEVQAWLCFSCEVLTQTPDAPMDFCCCCQVVIPKIFKLYVVPDRIFQYFWVLNPQSCVPGQTSGRRGQRGQMMPPLKGNRREYLKLGIFFWMNCISTIIVGTATGKRNCLEPSAGILHHGINSKCLTGFTGGDRWGGGRFQQGKWTLRVVLQLQEKFRFSPCTLT